MRQPLVTVAWAKWPLMTQLLGLPLLASRTLGCAVPVGAFQCADARVVGRDEAVLITGVAWIAGTTTRRIPGI
jgi:hypothetical protein